MLYTFLTRMNGSRLVQILAASADV